MRFTTSTAVTLAFAAGGAVTAVQAQPDYTIVPGFVLQSWNPGTEAPGRADWHPEKPGNGWANGLRWLWRAEDGMGNVVPPSLEPRFDSEAPGITGAFRFPEAAAASLSNNWEFQAQPNVAATFEIWFKPDDLEGNHVLWEIGAANKGVAIWLDDDELVYSARFSDAGSVNVVSYEHRETLTDTDWRQAVLTIDSFTFFLTSYLDGQPVNSAAYTPSPTYRWSGGNQAGLGTVGGDPLFPLVGIANDPDPIDTTMDGIPDTPSVIRTDFNGLIGPHRFYNIDLLANEVAQNYATLTDSGAAEFRADFNGDGVANATDVVDYLTFTAAADTTAITPFTYPFPSLDGGGLQTNDPAFDDTYVGDQTWDRDDGFNPTGQEASWRLLLAGNALQPEPVNDLSFPTVRRAFVMDGSEGFRGPKFEQADDSGSLRVQVWMYFDDVTGNHCLFEAGGGTIDNLNAAGFSITSRGDEIGARINSRANDGLDIVEIASGPGALQAGWQKIELIIRAGGPMIGEGMELYVDGVQVAAINDEAGPDGMFGTADDIDNISTQNPANNTNFVGGNQAGLGKVQGTAFLPFGFEAGDVTPFNGKVAGLRVDSGFPMPADVAAQFAADLGQNVVNDRADVNGDGQADFFDTLDQLSVFDNAK